MREKIDCFLPCSDLVAAEQLIGQLRGSKTIHHIFLLVNEPLSEDAASQFSDCRQICVDSLTSSQTMM